jgi:hypothetical protein
MLRVQTYEAIGFRHPMKMARSPWGYFICMTKNIALISPARKRHSLLQIKYVLIQTFDYFIVETASLAFCQPGFLNLSHLRLTFSRVIW